MLQEMSASEFATWETFFAIEPMPERRADIRAAEIIRSVIWSTGSKHVPALSRLIPDYWGELAGARRQTPAQIESALAAVLAARRKRKANAT